MDFYYPEITWLKVRGCDFDVNWLDFPSVLEGYDRTHFYVDLSNMDSDEALLFLLIFKGRRTEYNKIDFLTTFVHN